MKILLWSAVPLLRYFPSGILCFFFKQGKKIKLQNGLLKNNNNNNLQQHIPDRHKN